MHQIPHSFNYIPDLEYITELEYMLDHSVTVVSTVYSDEWKNPVSDKDIMFSVALVWLSVCMFVC